VPQRRHRDTVDAAQGAAELRRPESALENDALVGARKNPQFLEVVGMGCRIAEHVQRKVVPGTAADGFDREMHALVAGQGPDVADAQGPVAAIARLRRPGRSASRIESVGKDLDAATREALSLEHSLEELRRRDDRIRVLQFAEQGRLASDERVRTTHRSRLQSARRRRLLAQRLQQRAQGSRLHRLLEGRVDATHASESLVRRAVAQGAVPLQQQEVRAQEPEVHQVYGDRDAQRPTLAQHVEPEVAQVEHVHDVELALPQEATHHAADQRVLVVAQFAIPGVARMHRQAAHRNAFDHLVPLEPVLARSLELDQGFVAEDRYFVAERLQCARNRAHVLLRPRHVTREVLVQDQERLHGLSNLACFAKNSCSCGRRSRGITRR